MSQKRPKRNTNKPATSSDDETDQELNESKPALRTSARRRSPTKRYADIYSTPFLNKSKQSSGTLISDKTSENDDSDSDPHDERSPIRKPMEVENFEDQNNVEGRVVFGFNTPKRRDGMAIAAMNTPKTPKILTKTPDTKCRNNDAKTPRQVRARVKSQIAKMLKDDSSTDFSADESDFKPSDSDNSSSDSECESENADEDEENDVKTPCKTTRQPITMPTPSRKSSVPIVTRRQKITEDYVPESDEYFTTHSSSKIQTSDHTLDRLKNPRMQSDRLFSLLASMKLSPEHETAISNIFEDYKTYFHKWLYILNEGFNIMLYGLGSKRSLLQTFHKEVLHNQPVLVVNGFFPSLTLKEILDSITVDILDLTSSAANPHETVDRIEEEFSLIPETHLYMIVHNIDGTMLRNSKAQEILSRLAKIPNIHLLASIDHINAPLLWDNNKLSNYNFSWWDCTTMLPYTDETAFENSLLVQNSGELALASLRSVFLSLTTNSRGIYMVIVKYQLTNHSNQSYQGMHFKDLYRSCREQFLVSSDLALRAQLTEFLDHKLVKCKRSIDGSELLQIPIEIGLLKQFLEETEQAAAK